MTDTSVSTTERPSRAVAKPDKPSRPLRVDGKLKAACDAMAYEGLSMYDAARKAEISTFSVREGLKKAHVVAYLRQQREILRESLCGANILVLAEVRDQTDNQNARVSAVKLMEQLGETNPLARSGTSATPGFTIVLQQIVQSPGPQPQIVQSDDANPLISHDRDSLHQNVDR